MNLSSLPFIRIHKEVSSRHTPYLWVLIALLVGLFLQAYMHNFNIVYITLFTLFSFASSACYFGRVNLFYLRADLVSGGRLFAKSANLITWQISHEQGRDAFDLRFTCNGSQTHVQRLLGHALVALEITFDQRGETVLEPLSLSSAFPLPHVTFAKTLTPPMTLLILPKPEGVPLSRLIARHAAAFGERGDFEGLRRYEHGDALSLIHWPSIAKGVGVQSRRFEHIRATPTLHFDFLEAGSDDEARLSQLCLWILECERQGRDFTLKLPTRRYHSKTEGIDAILDALARY
ncbi:MAG: DUF58 domain-containing protein [Campylobacterales bacterium]|nr:DUF58 domain-containing protein [Campylobacterales bacterium]